MSKKKNSDSWCSKLVRNDGSVLSGGAARNARIAAYGGMDNILTDVFTRATMQACIVVDDPKVVSIKSR